MFLLMMYPSPVSVTSVALLLFLAQQNYIAVADAFFIGSRCNINRAIFQPPSMQSKSRGIFSGIGRHMKNSDGMIDGIESPAAPTKGPSQISIENYQHKNFNLTYLYKRASPGREGDRPIILIHPVGVGLSSWFWRRVLEKYDDNPPIYAPDLIGTGIDHGGDAWNPKENGLFFPLSWVEGIETLMDTIAMLRWKTENNSSELFDYQRGCLVVAQGGLAPVGIMLAKRNPKQVEKLMLTSPPTYDDITTAIPEPELERNYNFLCSPVFGGFAFAILESREIIKLFSNLFLFQEDCGEEWLDETQREICVEARTPVQAFNAGLLQHRSFEEDLKELILDDATSETSGTSASAPIPNNKNPSTREIAHQILIVSGDGDKRAVDRQAYESELDRCTLTTIEGLNVLPWENPVGVIDLIKGLGY